MENKSKVKTIVGVLLILILLGVIGYLVYDKYITQNKVYDYEEKIKDLNKQIKEISKDNNAENGNDKNLVGAYIGIYNAPAEIGMPQLTNELLIVDEKNAVFCHQLGTTNECYKGTYSVSDNKLILYSTSKKEFNLDENKYEDVNDHSYISFLINHDQIEPLDEGFKMATLTKTKESDLRYANKAFEK